MPKRNLPVINDAIDLSKVRIASPCDASWDDMVGDDTKRHCESCDKSVHNFASMSRAEIGELLQTSDEVCGHLYMRKDGTFLTADCEVGLAALALEHARVNYHRLSALLVTGIAFITVALMSVMAPREKTEAVDDAFQKRIYEIRDRARFRAAEPGMLEADGGVIDESYFRSVDTPSNEERNHTKIDSEKMRKLFGEELDGAVIMGGVGITSD